MGTGCVRGSRRCWAGAVLVVLAVLGTHGAHGEETTGFFQEMCKSKCQYINGTERVRFVERFLYNRQTYVHFDSDVGIYVADSPLGETTAKYWNSQPDIIERKRAAVDRFCRHNYEVWAPYVVQRKGEPIAEPTSKLEATGRAGRRRIAQGHEPIGPPRASERVPAWEGTWAPLPARSFLSLPPVQPEVEIYPVQSGSLPQTDRLVCAVMDFYPPEIEVKWFKNGREETERVVATDVIQNGDWTYQVLVMLETSPQPRDTYTCQVEHASLQHPLTQHWGAQSDAARSKMLTGVGGLVLGLIFLALGLFLYLRNKKGRAVPQPAGLLN
uniref:Class II histocompatibility antigen, B-L beta chain-like n=1 Tax=Dromaius novaehollandiae TaxID=8790 RepID=A0A8C4PA08_DRONO